MIFLVRHDLLSFLFETFRLIFGCARKRFNRLYWRLDEGLIFSDQGDRQHDKGRIWLRDLQGHHVTFSVVTVISNTCPSGGGFTQEPPWRSWSTKHWRIQYVYTCFNLILRYINLISVKRGLKENNLPEILFRDPKKLVYKTQLPVASGRFRLLKIILMTSRTSGCTVHSTKSRAAAAAAAAGSLWRVQTCCDSYNPVHTWPLFVHIETYLGCWFF